MMGAIKQVPFPMVITLRNTLLAATATAFALVVTHCAPFQKKAAPVAAPRQNLQNQGLAVPQPINRSAPPSYTRGNVNGPYIAMTFDDGPHPSLTPRLLDILAARNIKATFYVVGQNIKMYPGVMRRIAAGGHEFGNHTWTHPLRPSGWADAPLRSEIQRTADIIIGTTGVAPLSYRPPGGSVTPHQKQWLYNDFGYPTILWAVDPMDWKDRNSQTVTNRILAQTHAGNIVLAHDIHRTTVDAMPATLDGLLAKGFRFITISQLLGRNTQHASTNQQPKMLSISFGPGGF